MKTQIEKTAAKLKGTQRSIYNEIRYCDTFMNKYDNLIGDTLLDMVIEISNDSAAKIIASEIKDNLRDATKEEAIALTYEVSNNRDYYLNYLLNEYSDKCRNSALETLREIYPQKSDDELRKLML